MSKQSSSSGGGAGKSSGSGSSAGKGSSSSGGSASSSGGKSSDTSGSLYNSWMTGYSFEACRNLYFLQRVQPPAEGEDADRFKTDLANFGDYRDTLLAWISTCTNLVSGWGAVGADEITSDLQQMADDVAPRRTKKQQASPAAGTPSPAPAADLSSMAAELTTIAANLTSIAGAGAANPPKPPAPPAEPPSLKIEDFDSDFDDVIGAVRAKVPYGQYAVLFGQYSSRLQHLGEGDDPSAIVKKLRGWLTEMGTVLPQGVYGVIDHDLSSIEDGKTIGGQSAEHPIPGQGQGQKPNPNQALSEEVHVWEDLVFGTVTPRELLNEWGVALLYLSVAVVGLSLFFVAGLIIAVVFLGVTHIPNIDLSTLSYVTGGGLISSVATVTTTLTTVGLSLSLLVTKAWTLVQDFEKAAIVFFAKRLRLRKSVGTPYSL